MQGGLDLSDRYYGKVRGSTSGAKFHAWVDDVPLCQGKKGGGHGDYIPPLRPISNRPVPQRMCNTCAEMEA